jgi:23S rRNA (guanosine2251-2'-O)-methyltransferase
MKQNRPPNGKEKRRDERDRRMRPHDRPHPEEHRARSGLIFGVLPVLEVLRSNARRVEKIVVAEGARVHRLSEIFDLAREHRIIIDRAGAERLNSLAGTGNNHQGVIAFAAAADYVDSDEILDATGGEALLVLLDGVEDPRNLGAVLRTAECAGAHGVFIPERRAVGLNETVAKSSSGALEHIKVAKVTNLNRLIEDLKSRDIWVVGTSGDAELNYTDWDWARPSALVMGSEGAGLHRLVAENCDALVKIPMYGRIDSLNVSVAAGVVLFEARRQREAISRSQVQSSTRDEFP